MNSEIVTGSNGEVQYVTIAEAAGGQTYAAQLTVLWNKFQTLTQSQKEKTIIIDSGGNIYHPALVTNNVGIYSKVTMTTGLVLFTVFRLQEQKYLVRQDMGTITDSSGTTSSDSLYLKMLV